EIQLLGEMQIGRVEGRILADHHRRKLTHLDKLWLTQCDVRSYVADAQRAHHCEDRRTPRAQILRQAMMALVTTALSRSRKGKSGVLVRQHGFCRVHNEQNFHEGMIQRGSER